MIEVVRSRTMVVVIVVCGSVVSIDIVVVVRVPIRTRWVVSIYDNTIGCARGNEQHCKKQCECDE